MTVKINHDRFSICNAKFIRPGSVMRNNPLEAPGSKLVAELARVGWEVPGIDVRIDTSGKGRDVSRHVSSVSLETPEGKMRLTYGNRQRDGAYGLYGVTIKGRPEAWLYDDGSGDANKATVETACRNIENAIERLGKIDSAPGHDDVTEEGDAVMRRLCHVEPVPVPHDFPVLYAWADREESYRLAGYGDDADSPENDYGLSSGGWRLCSLGTSDGNPVDPKVYHSYTYASDDPSVRASQVVYRVKEDALPVEIRLKHLNDVHVVDNAAFRHARDKAFELAEAEGRDGLTHAEIDGCILATARTMVPYAEYVGGFEDPVIIIGRQIAADETRLMRGPISVDLDGEGVATTLDDTTSGIKMDLFRGRMRTIPYSRTAERVADEAARLLQVERSISDDVKAILANNPQPSLETLLARP